MRASPSRREPNGVFADRRAGASEYLLLKRSFDTCTRIATRDMAITYQFNKTSLQGLEKDLKMRQRTLPTLQSKETALRLEVKKAKRELDELDEEVNRRIKDYDQMIALWGEFDTSLIHVCSSSYCRSKWL